MIEKSIYDFIILPFILYFINEIKLHQWHPANNVNHI